MRTLVVLPTYNEAQNLPRMAAELLSLGVQVLVIDDNSPDGTGQIADELQAKHPAAVNVIHRAGKLGLGTAYVTGFKYALAHGVDAVIQMDADFSHSPSYIPKFLPLLAEYDVVIGSRYTDGGRLDDRWPLWRRGLSGFGNWYARTITGLPIRDVTSGFRFYTRQALAGLPLDRLVCSGYAFQIEVAYVCYRLGYRIHEEPITFEEREQGQSKMSTKIMFEAMWRVWQMKWRY